MHLHVLGLGSIGCLLAHSLRQALPEKHTISLIHKSIKQRQYFFNRRVIRVERQGALKEISGFKHELFAVGGNEALPKPMLRPGEEETGPKDAVASSDTFISSLFVTLKAHQTRDALETLAPRLTENSTVVLLQNGMGVYEQVVETIFRDPRRRPHFILASNTHGAFTQHHFHITHAGIGAINFGIMTDPLGRDFERGLQEQGKNRRLRLLDVTFPDDPHAARYSSLRDTVAALLMAQNLNTSWLPLGDVQLAMQRKLVVNAVINPLTALLRCRNGELPKYEHGMIMMRQICEEASAIYQAQWVKEQHQYQQELVYQGAIQAAAKYPIPPFPQVLSADELEAECLAVATTTAGNSSSMLEDVRRGRPVEIDHINGYLLDMARDYNVPAPVNEVLYNLLKLRSAMPLDQFL